MGIKHSFVSGVTDAANTSLVRPSNWNDDHTVDGDVDFSGFDLTNFGLGSGAGALGADLEDQTITGGAVVTSKSLGTVSSGGLTPDPGDRPMQHYTNGGAHTLSPGALTGSYFLDVVNNASAGAITTSGWTFVAGDSFTTTNGDKFRCSCSIGANGSLLVIQAMQ